MLYLGRGDLSYTVCVVVCFRPTTGHGPSSPGRNTDEEKLLLFTGLRVGDFRVRRSSLPTGRNFDGVVSDLGNLCTFSALVKKMGLKLLKKNFFVQIHFCFFYGYVHRLSRTFRVPCVLRGSRPKGPSTMINFRPSSRNY